MAQSQARYLQRELPAFRHLLEDVIHAVLLVGPGGLEGTESARDHDEKAVTEKANGS